MPFNLDTFLETQAAQTLIDGIRQRLELASYRLDSVAIVALQLHDACPEMIFSPEQKQRLLAAAKEGIEGATRREVKKERRVADLYFLVDSLLFVILFNAYQRNYLIPVWRILQSLGAEARVVHCLAGDAYVRNVAIGSAFWLPRYGEVKAQGMLGRALEALSMAHTMPLDTLYERLEHSSLPHLAVRYFEYPWDELPSGKRVPLGPLAKAVDRLPSSRPSDSALNHPPQA